MWDTSSIENDGCVTTMFVQTAPLLSTVEHPVPDEVLFEVNWVVAWPEVIVPLVGKTVPCVAVKFTPTWGTKSTAEARTLAELCLMSAVTVVVPPGPIGLGEALVPKTIQGFERAVPVWLSQPAGARPGIAAPPVVLGVYRGGGQVIQGRNIANQAIEIGTDTCDRAPVRVGHVDATLRRLSGDGRHAALRDRVALDDRIARAQPNLMPAVPALLIELPVISVLVEPKTTTPRRARFDNVLLRMSVLSSSLVGDDRGADVVNRVAANHVVV